MILECRMAPVCAGRGAGADCLGLDGPTVLALPRHCPDIEAGRGPEDVGAGATPPSSTTSAISWRGENQSIGLLPFGLSARKPASASQPRDIPMPAVEASGLECITRHGVTSHRVGVSFGQTNVGTSPVMDGMALSKIESQISNSSLITLIYYHHQSDRYNKFAWVPVRAEVRARAKPQAGG